MRKTKNQELIEKSIRCCNAIEGEIFEASTPHYDDDSYRIEKGDSQK